MISEYDNEPIRGLPGYLPEGENIVWQGSPDWRVLAHTAFHTRAVTGYFGLLALVAVATSLWDGASAPADFIGVGMTLIVGMLGVGLLNLLAWASARTTIYTLTDRRIVLRIGIALPKCINLPLTLVRSVDLDLHADGSGNLAVALTGDQRLGYAGLWPHARPWHVAVPQPMLRAVPDAEKVARSIADACVNRSVPVAAAHYAQPDFARAQAA